MKIPKTVSAPWRSGRQFVVEMRRSKPLADKFSQGHLEMTAPRGIETGSSLSTALNPSCAEVMLRFPSKETFPSESLQAEKWEVKNSC